MSTRANIEVFRANASLSRPYEPEKGLVMLYRHWDGYPEEESGVFATWQGFLKARYPNGTGYEYPLNLATEAIHYFWIDEPDGFRGLQNSRAGLELTEGLHGDIEYYYQVILGKKDDLVIKAYKRTGSEMDDNFNPMGEFVSELRYLEIAKDA